MAVSLPLRQGLEQGHVLAGCSRLKSVTTKHRLSLAHVSVGYLGEGEGSEACWDFP